MEFETDDTVWQTAKRSLCITGVGRSGTTILGTLMYSLQEVEYQFEPPSLVYLLHCIEHLNPDVFRYIFSHIVYSEVLGRSLAGRNLNFNSHDWSYVFKAKTPTEVRKRFEHTMTASDFHDACSRFTPAFKIPDIIRQSSILHQRVPGIRTIAMIRNPSDTVASMVRRRWYADPITFATSGAIKRFGTQLIPYGLDRKNADRWISMSDIDRSYLIYINEYQHLLEAGGFIIVDYDRLVSSPEATLKSLSNRFGLSFGPTTTHLLRGIFPRAHPPLDRQGSTDLQESARELYHRALAHALPPFCHHT